MQFSKILNFLKEITVYYVIFCNANPVHPSRKKSCHCNDHDRMSDW